MSGTAGTGEPGGTGQSGEKTPADLAAAVLKNCVDNYVEQTKGWLDGNRHAFVDAFDRSLAGTYTAGHFVQDGAAMWARTVQYLAGLATVGTGVPADPGPQAGQGPQDEGPHGEASNA
jgi:hypothetical protein